MEFIKKQNAGVWATCITLLFAIISIIVYNINIGSEGYFKGASVGDGVTFMVVELVILVAVIVLAQIKAEGAANTAITLISDAARIAAPAVAIAALLTILASRVEGFAFIYFSNAEVLQEIQTAANMSSAKGAIATLVLLGITAVVGIVAAFFSTRKTAK